MTGPIAAGKSIVAVALAELLAKTGTTSAVADLDAVVEMIPATIASPARWRAARIAHAALVSGFVASGIEVVIADGPFFTDDEATVLLGGIEQAVRPFWLTVTVPFDEALARVAADPTRGLSRDPAFLRQAHKRYVELSASGPPSDLSFDTSTVSANAIAALVASKLTS